MNIVERFNEWQNFMLDKACWLVANSKPYLDSNENDDTTNLSKIRLLYAKYDQRIQQKAFELNLLNENGELNVEALCQRIYV